MFVDLPLDIHLAIFGFLKFLDILAVGRTCQVLHDVALQRVVWTNAFKKMCATNAVYTPSFKLKDLSITELQKVVGSPDRMIGLLQKGGGLVGRWEEDEQPAPHIVPRTHVINAPLQVSGEESYFTAVYIVPGGRYLVTTGDEFLHIWDLKRLVTVHGVPLISQIIPRVGDHNSAFCVCPGSDPRIFRVVLSGTWVKEDNSKMAKLVIYEFSEATKQNGLKLYESPVDVDFNNDGSGWYISVYSLYKDICVYVCGRDLHIWNIVEDTCTSWTTPDLECEEIFIDAYHIVLITRSSVLVWEIPDLHPRMAIPLRCPEEIRPRFSMQQDTQPNTTEPILTNPATRYSCVRILDWYNRSHTLKTFDFLLKLSEEDLYTLSTLSIALPASKFGGATEFISSLELPPSHDIVMDARVCNNHIVKGWRDKDYYNLLMSPLFSNTIPFSSVTELSRIQRFLLDDLDTYATPEWRRDEYSFDPISGQLCAIEEGGSVRVFNLLSFE